MRFVGAVYFWTDELFPKIDRRFPKDLDDFSDDQKEKLNDYICKNVRMYTHDENLNDTIGIKPYSTDTYFNFECRVMPWNNDKIRINFLSGVGGIRIIGK